MITTGISSNVHYPLEKKGVSLLSFSFLVDRRPLFKKTWSGFFYLSSKRNRKFNKKHLVQTEPVGENTISNMKVSCTLFVRQCDQMCVCWGNLSSNTLECHILLMI